MISISEHFNYKKIIKFTLPSIIMMLFTSIYGLVDGIFVSNLINSDAFAAINIFMPLTLILGSIGHMFGTGGSAIVAKTLGEKQNKKAIKYFSMIIYFLIVLGSFLTIICITFIKPIVVFLGAKDNILTLCINYGTILLIAIPFQLLQNAFQSFFTTNERPNIGLFISILSGIANLILDFIFMYIMHFGIKGAAIATAISQILGGGVSLLFFIFNKGILRLTKTTIDLKLILKTAFNGLSEMISNSSYAIINIIYNLKVIKYVGINGVVAYGIINYVSYIFISIYLGYMIGIMPVISYNYGANNSKELKNIFYKSLKILGIIAIFLTFIAIFYADEFTGIFIKNNDDLISFCSRAFKIFSIAYIIDWFNIFSSSFFTALNDGKISAIISIFRTLIAPIIIINLIPIILGSNNIWFSEITIETFSIILNIYFIIKYKNKYGY